ncbi:hypothetical protein JKY79_03025 [Candidatus Babeliales bacterium]|nr:hypothetical protein [Candidatus Babeliales bacterium]
MRLLLLILLLFTGGVNAEYEIDVGYSHIKHAWRGPDNIATFQYDMPSIGITWWRGRIGIRGSYADGGLSGTDGRYKLLEVDMKYIAGLELLYKYQITDDLRLILGVGTYLIPVNVYYLDGTLERKDRDDDEGFNIRVDYSITEHWSISYKFSEYSRIKSDLYDEWIRGHSAQLITLEV